MKNSIFYKLFILVFLFFLASFSIFKILNVKTFAATGINKQISFQGKVVNTNGTNVTSGNYDMEFKIYYVGSGGAAIWTETRTGGNQVAVLDGVFQVNLGSVTTLPGAVDFNSDSIYLSINFNNNGEMNTRVRFTATPYAMNAGKVAGLTVTDTTGTLTIPSGKTVAFSDAFTTLGAYGLTLTTTNTTSVTLPTTGVLSTLSGTETFVNKTIGVSGLIFSGASTDIDTVAAEGLVLQGRAASTFQTTAGNITLQPGGAGLVASVLIGAGGVGSTAPDFFGLDVKSTSGDPVSGGFEGAMYYNTVDNKFRCYQDAAWTDCIGSAGVTSTGTANYVPKFTSANVIQNSLIYDNGTYIGIGTTLPGTYKLNVNGNVNVTGSINLTAGITAPTTGNTINGLVINAGALSSITTLGMNNQLTNSYANTAALNLTGNAAGITFTGSNPNTINTASGVNLAFMPGTTGNVGIGTTAPLFKLDVNGNSRIGSTAFFASSVGVGISVPTGIFQVNVGNTTPIFASATGNVGIGTTAPLNRLHIEGTNGAAAGIYLNQAIPSGTASTLYNNGGTLYWNGSAVGGGAGVTSTGTANYISKFTSASIIQNSLLYETATGIGIGRTNPGSKLEVNGDARIGDGTNYANLSTTGDLSLVGNADYLVGDNRYAFRYVNDENYGLMFNSATGSYDFKNSTATTIFSIDANVGNAYMVGNFGIGTTDYSSTLNVNGTLGVGSTAYFMSSVGIGKNNPDGALDVVGAVAADSFRVLNGSTDLVNNSPWFGMGISDLMLPGSISNAIQLAGYYGINFATQGGNTMTLSKVGNLGIGTTNPSSKLDVTGDIEASGQIQMGTGTSAPTALGNGAMYYNSTTKKAQLYENGTWKNVISTGTTGKVKSTNQGATNSSTAWNNDSDLYYAMAPSKTYYVTADIDINMTNATADAKYSFSIPANTTISMRGVGETGALAGSSAPMIACNIFGNTSPCPLLVGTTSRVRITITGTVTTNSSFTTGNLQFVFSQNASTAATSPTIMAGSMLEVTDSTNYGADLAEMYNTNDETIVSGDVVSIDPELDVGVRKSRGRYDPQVLGVISTKPGLILHDGEPQGKKSVLVALSGRIPINVSTENGEIKAGDYLTSSSVPGVAMKATKSGYVIAQAMTDFSSEGTGTVLAFIKNTYFNGVMTADGKTGIEILTQLVQDQSVVTKPEFDLSQIMTDRLVAGLEIISPKVVTKELIATNITGEDAYFSGTITANKIKANQIEGLEIVTSQISMLKNQYDDLSLDATSSAVLGSTAPAVQTDTSDTISMENVKVLLSMEVLGNLQAKGGIVVSSDARFNGETVFEALANFFGKVIFNAKTVFVKTPLFNQDAGGVAVIKKDMTTVYIKFNEEYEGSPVVNANVISQKISDEDLKNFIANKKCEVDSTVEICQSKLEKELLDNNFKYIISDIDSKGFKIAISQKAPFDIVFNWSAMAIDDLKKIESQVEPNITPTNVQISVFPTKAPESIIPTAAPTPTPVPEQSIIPTAAPTPTPDASVNPEVSTSSAGL